MLSSAGYPANDLENLRLNTLADGLFHATTYIFVLLGLALLWRTAHVSHLWWSTKLLIGTLLIGLGSFNLVEGVVNHHFLDLHHVNETVPGDEWIYWDIGFLVWGAAMLVCGLILYRAGEDDSPEH